MFIENSDELAQNKLILLYIFEKIDYPITNSEITQFVLENNHMNYFLVQQYLSELVSTNFISIKTQDGNEYYNITNNGKKVLGLFEGRISINTKEIIDDKCSIKKQEKIKEKQIIGNYYKKNDVEYIVNLKVVENDNTIFTLSLNVVSNEQAKMICNNWRENPQIIYKDFIDILTKKQD
ncbi:MAG: DUF4364 family protein [Senegalia sp. (in: firmicutes)]|uniref:DUF4364 family protein n=1 Tax=Senegalia sp. (in: firmicutes) TaxID=1924098 RepID=UPI003F9946E6